MVRRMSEYRFELPYQPNDNVVFLVTEGKMAGIASKSEQYVRRHADRIHELMIMVMKHPMTRQGVWIFRISDEWRNVSGQLIAMKEQK